jgi:hypothetical protein
MTLRLLRAAAAAALLALCAPPDGRSQATNLPARVSTSFALSTNGVVRAPAGPIYWPTQTNYLHRASVTNLVIGGTVTGLGASQVTVADAGGWWASNTVEGVLAEVGVALDSIAGDVTGLDVVGGLLTVTDPGGPVPVIGLATSAVTQAVTAFGDGRWLGLGGGTVTGDLNLTQTLTVDVGASIWGNLFVAGDVQATSATADFFYGGEFQFNGGGVIGGNVALTKDSPAVTLRRGSGTAPVLDFQNDPGEAITQAGVLSFSRSAEEEGVTNNYERVRLTARIQEVDTDLASGLDIRAADDLGTMQLVASFDGENALASFPGSIWAADYQGNGSGLEFLDAGNLASGTVPTARLGSGTADGTTFLRGDGTWAAAGLTAFTESLDTAAPNNTRNNARLLATGAGANIAVTFQPKGTGGISGQRPDSAASGGNVRGEYAVDWQLARTSASQVASGQYSVVAGGYRNIASSLYDVVIGGDRCEATGGFGSIAGGYVARAQSTGAVALGHGPTAAHAYSAAFGFDSSSGPTTDRAEQVKFRTGSITLQTDTGTLSNWGKQASAPGSPTAGDMYYDTGTNKMRCFDGSNWNDLW